MSVLIFAVVYALAGAFTVAYFQAECAKDNAATFFLGWPLIWAAFAGLCLREWVNRR